MELARHSSCQCFLPSSLQLVMDRKTSSTYFFCTTAIQTILQASSFQVRSCADDLCRCSTASKLCWESRKLVMATGQVSADDQPQVRRSSVIQLLSGASETCSNSQLDISNPEKVKRRNYSYLT